MTAVGMRAIGLIAESADGSTRLTLPTLMKYEIPNVRDEIPFHDIARHQTHLKEIAEYILTFDGNAQISLLIGRDLPGAHHVLNQVTGPRISSVRGDCILD